MGEEASPTSQALEIDTIGETVSLVEARLETESRAGAAGHKRFILDIDLDYFLMFDVVVSIDNNDVLLEDLPPGHPSAEPIKGQQARKVCTEATLAAHRAHPQCGL